jgi:arylsulfatase A-like enzyme
MKILTPFSVLLALASISAPAFANNVLLIVGDDVGVDKVGAFDGMNRTPRLDLLAANGVRFERVYSNPLCSPTRATIMTGRYSFRTGVGTVLPQAPPLPLGEFTLPEALSAGSGDAIACGAFGKWHLSRTTAVGVQHPLFSGFDWYQGVIAGAVTDYYSWPKSTNGALPVTRNAYATTDNVDDALAWIQAQDGSWFCYLAFNAAHTPFHRPPEDLYTPEPPLPPGDPCDDPVPFYNAMLEAMDSEIGRLLDGMDGATLANTTILFVGDNGSDGLVTLPPADPLHSKGSFFEGGIHVPLIISGAGVSNAGLACDRLVNTSDLFATVIELFGIDPAAVMPDGRPLDSISLVPYLTDPGHAPLRNYIYSELFEPPAAAGATQLNARPVVVGGTNCGAGGELVFGEAARNTRYKLIRKIDGSEEFYDLSVDPAETNNLLKLPSIPAPGPLNLFVLRNVLDALGI